MLHFLPRSASRFACVDTGIFGHVTRRNLARLAEEQGDEAEAARHWSGVLAERPSDAEAARALGRLERGLTTAREPSSRPGSG